MIYLDHNATTLIAPEVRVQTQGGDGNGPRPGGGKVRMRNGLCDYAGWPGSDPSTRKYDNTINPSGFTSRQPLP
jgi:hypothetical protein